MTKRYLKMEKKAVRVQDDLYHAVNDEWLATAKIPDDLPCCGGFSDLAIGVEKTMMDDFKAMAEGGKAIPDAYMEKAVALFKKGRDVARRNAEGIKPLLPELAKIDALRDIADMNAKLPALVIDDNPLPFQLGVDTNMKDTLHHACILVGPRALLPDTTYYGAPQLKAQKDALIGVLTAEFMKLLSFTPLPLEKHKQYVDDAFAFDAIVATLVKSQQEWSEYTKCYNPMKSEEAIAALKPLDFGNLLSNVFGKIPDEVIVYEPRFLKGFSTLFNEKNFPMYKHWAYLKALMSGCAFLSEELRTIANTYSRTISGQAVDASIEKQAYRNAGNAFSEPVGLYYGRTYFGEEAKKDVVKIVEEIIATYEKRMAKNDFLSPATKEKAILKLSKIVIKMGYPDKCQPLYDKLTVDEDASFYEAVCAISRQKNLDAFGKLYKDVDRSEWVMPGHMVNACYDPMKNDITFPAAILQAPFYSLKQTRSENLGGIGSVIGHEISHAFDNNGAQCDENGNLSNWWTPEDFKSFQAKTEAMVKEFDGIPFAGGKMNGAFVVSENIADNGGMAVTLDMMSRLKGADYKEYFLNWGRIWCQKARPQYQQLLLSIDVHSPAELRANMQPRNFAEWYRTFDVKPTDKMYLAPESRVDLW